MATKKAQLPIQFRSTDASDYIRDISDKAERRFFTASLDFSDVEVNGGMQKSENVIEGYAAVFNKDSEDFGGWIERIAPGFFSDVLNDDVYALFNHSMNQPLGRNKVNVTLTQDDVGLRYKINPLPDTNIGNDMRALIRSGIINKSSFAFTVSEETFTKGDPSKGIPHVRTLIKCERLYDVSPVTVPAYPDTSVAARSLKKLKATEEIREAISALDLRLLYNINKYKQKQLFK
jgi:HK97 family phage prohead protease